MAYELGTVSAAEQLLDDLYVSLRRRLANWAPVTQQTPQARMGYVGQHLTSVVTGHPGGRSGARGHDLVIGGGHYGEIKTCSRVDQLGKCGDCSSPVSSLEIICGSCESENVIRNDDSKWLIAVPNEAEFAKIFEADVYYFVLFDFEDFANPLEVNARIYQVNPRSPGFALCMVDYYWNIRANSRSKAPFNMWPFSPKFYMMEPELIYHARIAEDNTIDTLLFPGVGPAVPTVMPPIGQFRRSTTITPDALEELLDHFGVAHGGGLSRKLLFDRAEAAQATQGWPNEEMMRVLARDVYMPRIGNHTNDLPSQTLEMLADL